MNKSNYYIAAFALMIATSWAVATLISQQTNSLYYNEHWESSKIPLYKGVVGAVAFITTRTALSQQQLNLGTWHGFNEIIYKKNIKPRQVSYEFTLSTNADLTFIFDKNETGFKGIKISKNPNFPNFYFESDGIGLFHTMIELQSGFLKKEKNKLNIEFNKEVSVNLNGNNIGILPQIKLGANQVGFRSQLGDTLVDSVTIVDENGESFVENFENRDKWNYFFQSLILMVIVFGLLNFFVLKNRAHLMHVIAVIFNALTILILVIIADSFYFSKRYPVTMFEIEKWLSSVNVSKFTNNIEGESDIIPREIEKIKNSKKRAHQIVLLGSSQTWGAGARSADEQLEKYLLDGFRQKYPARKIELANLAVSGFSLQKMIDKFILVRTLKVDTVILNASNNDVDAANFEKNLRKLIEHCKRRKITLHFVQESNFLSDVKKTLLDNHKIMNKLSIEKNINLIPAHDLLKVGTKKGFYWWDDVHLTSAGQKELATIIIDRVQLPR